MKATRILIVEDERIIATHIRQQLAKLGYDVPRAVATGERALHEIEESRPDLVLMDINLKGGMDGIATAGAIPAAHRIPVIYLTAYSGDATLERAAATNPYGYLLKPFSERELNATIQMALARCRSERESRLNAERHHQAKKMDALVRLAGGVADEVQNLLDVAFDQWDVTRDRANIGPALAATVREAFEQAFASSRLTRILLDFSGRRPMKLAMVPITELLAALLDHFRQVAGDMVNIRLDCTEGVWHARLDREQLTHALCDLIENARDSMPNGGDVRIEARNVTLGTEAGAAKSGGNFIVLSVSDSGIGMTEEAVERAFDPFFTTKQQTGRGLGLSLVFAFVKQIGGHVSIDSKPGGGTTVRLFLPTIPDHKVLCESRNFSTTAVAPVRRRPYAAAQNASVIWRRADQALFGTLVRSPGCVHLKLIVEPLPGRASWDWAVWRSGDSGNAIRHGHASSVISAIAAAEATSWCWVETRDSPAAASPSEFCSEKLI